MNITAYRFDELSEEAKERAIGKYSHIPSQQDAPWNQEIDNWKMKIEEAGYYKPKLHWSCCGSQGDGASFTATIDPVAWLDAHPDAVEGRKELLEAIDSGNCYIDIRTSTSGRYVHSNTISVDVEHEFYAEDPDLNDRLDNAAIELERAILEDMKTLSNKFFRALQDLSDSLYEDEYVSKFFTEEGYLFNEEGLMFTIGDYPVRVWMLQEEEE